MPRFKWQALAVRQPYSLYMAEVFKNRERAQDFYLVSVEVDLAREGSKLN